MFFLFGWGNTTNKKEDETPIEICEHCHTDYLYLTKVTSWFTVFFIPVFPYESEYYYLCHNCEYGFELKHDQVEGIKDELEKFKKKNKVKKKSSKTKKK